MARRSSGRSGGDGKRGGGKAGSGRQRAGWPSKKEGKSSGRYRDNNPPKSGKK